MSYGSIPGGGDAQANCPLSQTQHMPDVQPMQSCTLWLSCVENRILKEYKHSLQTWQKIDGLLTPGILPTAVSFTYSK